MAKIGTVNMRLYACTDLECIRAGHPNHPGTVTEWPDGTVETRTYAAREPVTDDEGRLYSWWGVCLTCGAEPHAPDPDDADFGKHRPGCPAAS